MQKNDKGKKTLAFILLQAGLFLFSLAGVCSKFAGKQAFLSWKFILFYGLMLTILVVYAVIWQQVLKVIPLTVAYGCKGICLFYGLFWGALLFGEKIRPNMIIGALIVLAGVLFFVLEDAKNEERRKAAETMGENRAATTGENDGTAAGEREGKQ